MKVVIEQVWPTGQWWWSVIARSGKVVEVSKRTFDTADECLVQATVRAPEAMRQAAEAGGANG